MTTKLPDLDARWHPVNPATELWDNQSSGGMVHTSMSITIPEELHRQFLTAAEQHDISARELITRIYYEACRELDIDTDRYEALLNKRNNTWRKRFSTKQLHISEVVMDECDLPGVVEAQDIADVDPYYTSFVVQDLSEAKRSRQMWRLEREINKATNAIERLTSLKSYTSVFAEGRISKEEARRELKLILDMMPEEINDTLWGWCSVNDCINLIRRWKRQIVTRMKLQLEIEQLRFSAKRRADFEAKAEARIQASKQRILETYKKQRRLRPRHGAEWPTWAGRMESYLDHAASPEMYDVNSRWYNLMVRDTIITPDGDEHTITEVQSNCTVDISKGLTDDKTK